MNKTAPVVFAALLLVFARAAGAPAPAPGGTAIAGFLFRAPADWQPVSTEEAALTRLAEWALPGGAEVVVLRFGNGRPGEIQANLNRWAASVTTPTGTPAAARIVSCKVGGVPLTQVQAFGTYLSPESGAPGLPPAALPGSGLVGTVLELPGGPLYVRLTGPEAAVRRALPGLEQFLESVRPASPPAAKG